MTTSKKNAGYSYDVTTNTLTITADFAKKASQINTAEYRIVRQFRMENPGITIERKTINANRPHAGIKYEDMERYMSLCRTGDTYLRVFQTVKKLSKGQPSPYKYVRHWFDNLFPHYSEQPIIDADGFIVENPEDVKVQKPLALPASSVAIELPISA